MPENYGIWYKVVTIDGEHSCCWALNRKYMRFKGDVQCAAFSSLRKVYRDGSIVGTTGNGLFIFRHFVDAKLFMEQSEKWKIKSVRPLTKPKEVTGRTYISPYRLKGCRSIRDLNDLLSDNNRVSIESFPAGSFMCNRLEVICDEYVPSK